MRADFRVVLDACTLAPASLAEFLLRLASTPRLYVPRWSAQILNETEKTQTEKLKWKPEDARLWRSTIEAHFPEAMVTGYENLIKVCENDEKDRHVLATAIRTQAEMIVTFNLRDFHSDALKPWGITASHPADYLITLYSIDPGVVVAKLDDFSRERKLSREQLLVKLGRTVPAFSRYVAEALGLTLPE